jgi:hypothetical protein
MEFRFGRIAQSVARIDCKARFDMNLTIEFVGGGIVAPAAIAIVVFLLVRVILSPEAGERYSASVAFAAAYVAGYLLVAAWAPDRHWQWTFYLVLIVAVVGPVAAARGLAVGERWILYLLLALVSAWLLVPNWPNLVPPRTVWVAVLTLYLFVLTALLAPLARRIPSATFVGSLAISSICVSILVTAFISINYGELAGIAAAGLVGCWVASFFWWQRSALGVELAYSVIVGGLAFIGCVEPLQPYLGLLVAPAAPLALWCGDLLPALRRLHRPLRTVVQIALVVAVLGVATVMVVVAGS